MRDIWLREDDTHAVDMCCLNNNVYILDDAGRLGVMTRNLNKKDLEWGATFCTINETINERKVYSKFHLRMELGAGAWVAVDVKTDNENKWQQVSSVHNSQIADDGLLQNDPRYKSKTVSIPIMPTRCDSIDIRIRGKGNCIIKSFVREYSTGSDV